MPAAIAIPAIIGAAGSIGSSLIGSHAAGKAAGQQSQSAQQAIDFQTGIWNQAQQNMSPYLSAGSTSIGNLMQGFQNGTFGAGSLNNLMPGAFTAPSLQQARETPGYQFTQQQGIDAITRSAAARGALGSGGTLKALQSYGTGLADTTYNDVFQRAMQGYNANISRAQLGAQFQQQGFNQEFAPAQLGLQATESQNQLGQSVAGNVGNLMTQQGNAQAGGTLGAANAWQTGIAGIGNSILDTGLLNQLNKGGAAPNSAWNQGAPFSQIPYGTPQGPTTPPFLPPGTIPG